MESGGGGVGVLVHGGAGAARRAVMTATGEGLKHGIRRKRRRPPPAKTASRKIGDSLHSNGTPASSVTIPLTVTLVLVTVRTIAGPPLHQYHHHQHQHPCYSYSLLSLFFFPFPTLNYIWSSQPTPFPCWGAQVNM